MIKKSACALFYSSVVSCHFLHVVLCLGHSPFQCIWTRMVVIIDSLSSSREDCRSCGVITSLSAKLRELCLVISFFFMV